MRHLSSTRRRSILSGLAVIVIGLIPGLTLAQSAKNVMNVRSSKSGVELELSSTQEFPVRDALIQLHIGNKTFTNSRAPADGSLNTLIFSVPSSEVGALNDGDAIWVDFQGQGRSGLWWDFGKLNKKQLSRSNRETTP